MFHPLPLISLSLLHHQLQNPSRLLVPTAVILQLRMFQAMTNQARNLKTNHQPLVNKVFLNENISWLAISLILTWSMICLCRIRGLGIKWRRRLTWRFLLITKDWLPGWCTQFYGPSKHFQWHQGNINKDKLIKLQAGAGQMDASHTNTSLRTCMIIKRDEQAMPVHNLLNWVEVCQTGVKAFRTFIIVSHPCMDSCYLGTPKTQQETLYCDNSVVHLCLCDTVCMCVLESKQVPLMVINMGLLVH